MTLPLPVLLTPPTSVKLPPPPPAPPAPLNITWIGSPNGGSLRFYDVLYLFVHTAVGSLSSIDATFQIQYPNPVVSHYAVGLNGEIHQYLGFGLASWAQGGPNPGWTWPFGSENPNCRSISIETEDDGQPDTCPVTDAQFEAIVALYQTSISQVWQGITHLVAHRVVNPQHSCPGDRWLATGKFAELGARLGLIVVT